MNVCGCGCGQLVRSRFVRGHNRPHLDAEWRDCVACGRSFWANGQRRNACAGSCSVDAWRLSSDQLATLRAQRLAQRRESEIARLVREQEIEANRRYWGSWYSLDRSISPTDSRTFGDLMGVCDDPADEWVLRAARGRKHKSRVVA